jgi:CDP-diacylglycerol--glycerol-3-phosphate 3-phosphatidyltransferase
MAVPAFSCHPRVALGVVVFLCGAIFVSLRDVVAPRGAPAPVTRDQLGHWLRTLLSAFEPLLMRSRVKPVHLTLAQLVIGLLTGISYGAGCVFLAGCLLLTCGILDLLDGSLARRTARASRQGAFLDSVVDRYAEFFTFCGLGILFSGSWLVWGVVLSLFGSIMVSYARARAEGLGVDCRGGLMQRAERYVFLAACSFLSTILNHLLCAPAHSFLGVGLLAFAALTNATALSRVRATLSAFDEP